MSRRTRTRITIACMVADLAVIAVSVATGRALLAAAITAGVGLAISGVYLATRGGAR